MRVRNWYLVAAGAAFLGAIGISGCDNTQGTSANPELTRETVTYKDNDDPQNTGAGSGAIGKPPAPPSNPVGGETASQAAVKGTQTNVATQQ